MEGANQSKLVCESLFFRKWLSIWICIFFTTLSPPDGRYCRRELDSFLLILLFWSNLKIKAKLLPQVRQTLMFRTISGRDETVLPQAVWLQAKSVSKLFTHLLTHSFTHSLTNLISYSHTHSFSHLLSQSLNHSCIYSFTQLLIYSLSHLLIQSLIHSVTYSFLHLLVHSFTH